MNTPRELALRLFVAYASTIWGYTGMDHLLKKVRDQPIGSHWLRLAKAMLKDDPKIQ